MQTQQNIIDFRMRVVTGYDDAIFVDGWGQIGVVEELGESGYQWTLFGINEQVERGLSNSRAHAIYSVVDAFLESKGSAVKPMLGFIRLALEGDPIVKPRPWWAFWRT